MKDKLLLNPQQAYSLKVRDKLKKDKLPHWLLLQTDERWAHLPYGWGEENSTLAMNGCTIDALAIVSSLINNKETSPKKILSWSKNKYFTDDGTSWSIYKDFSREHNYKYRDLGANIENTQFYLKKNIPVIAAAQPGIFTTIGHTIVLTHFDNNGYRLLDPSDNSLKNHSLTTYSGAVLSNELIYFWTIYH